jgi:hypothetical protein
MKMVKNKKTRQELAFPVNNIPSLSNPVKPSENQVVIKQIIRSAIQGSFHLRTPTEPSPYSSDYGKKQKPLVTDEQIQLVTHLIETLQPSDAIEAALASQYVITYIRGLDLTQDTYGSLEKAVEMFRFGHEVLENLTKYRTKGAQLINVQYNHNQGQIVNIKNVKEDHTQDIADAESHQIDGMA